MKIVSVELVVERAVDRIGVAVGARLNCPLSEANFMGCSTLGTGMCPLYGVRMGPFLGGFKRISVTVV